MPDIYKGASPNMLTGPMIGGVAVTPSNEADLQQPSRMLYVGGTGNLSVILTNGETVTLLSVPAGTQLPIRAKRVLATGTTATNIVALY